MTEYFKFWCPKCGSDSFIKKEVIEIVTNYYNPPINYNIFSYNKDWAWSSEATTEENEGNMPSFYCEDCNYYVGDFEHTEKFIENGFKEGYIIKYVIDNSIKGNSGE